MSDPEKWEPWKALDELKSAYQNPGPPEAKNTCACSIQVKEGSDQGDEEAAMVRYYRRHFWPEEEG